MLRSRASWLVTLVVLGLACKREPEAAAETKPRDRKSRCEAIGADITRMGVMMAKGLAVGLSDGKAKIDPDEEAALRRELEVAEQELVSQCMEWPEEAVDCFGLSGALAGDKCERIMAAAMGDPVLPEDVPAGPSVAWEFKLPHDLSLLHGRSDGTAIAVVEPEDPSEIEPHAYVVAIGDGKKRWEQPLSFSPFLIEPLGDDAVLVVGDHDIVAFAASDGSKRWSTTSPDLGDPDDDDSGKAEIVAYAHDDKRTVLLLRDRRLLQLHPERCAKGPCTDVIATIELPETYGSRWLEPGPDGGWLVVDGSEGAAHVLDAAGKPRVSLLAHTSASWTSMHGANLRIGIDGAVAELDLGKCGGGTIAPIAWPPAGKPKWLANATVREIESTATPAGCVIWSTAMPHEGSGRIDTRDDSLVVQSGGFLVGLAADGAQTFKSPVNDISTVLARAASYAVVGDLGINEVSLVLSWVDPAGKHLKRSALPLGKGEGLILDDIELVAAGPAVIAGLDQTLVALVD